jgi:Tfp pilus assembly protein PilF
MRALQIKPNSLAINDLAGEYFMKGKYPEAIELCKKAIDLTPNDINAYINTGLCYMRVRQFDSATIYLHHAISIDPESGGALSNLAFTFRAMGQADSAKKYESMAQKVIPEFKLN